MRSHATVLSESVLTLTAALAFATPVIADDLPQTGTIKIHSNFKGNGHVVQVAEKHFMGSNNAWGVSYNDAAGGPLHMGTSLCTYAFDVLNGSYTNDGACAFGDAGFKDKIFTAFSGNGTVDGGGQGTGTITGGTGRYSGIQGKIAYQCKTLDATLDIFACTQQFDYQLKAAASRR